MTTLPEKAAKLDVSATEASMELENPVATHSVAADGTTKPVHAAQNGSVPPQDVAKSVTTLQRISHTRRSSVLEGVNMRDVARSCRGGMGLDTEKRVLKPGLVYRCSQVWSCNQMRKYGVKSVLDLREVSQACRRSQKEHRPCHEFLKQLAGPVIAPIKALPDRAKLPVHRSRVNESGCPCCQERFHQQFDADVTVYHADLLKNRMKLQIFLDMPWCIRLRTILAPFRGESAESVMAPAVANPETMGYTALYKLLLDLSQRSIAKALRVFVEPDNLPVVVHCIHGKDRTGLIVALLLLLVGVDEETVILDYAKSEVSLKASRDANELPLEAYLVADSVIASKRETMEETLQYLDKRYGGIGKYASLIGLTQKEIQCIRDNMLMPTEPASPPVSPRSSVAAGISNLLHLPSRKVC